MSKEVSLAGPVLGQKEGTGVRESWGAHPFQGNYSHLGQNSSSVT